MKKNLITATIACVAMLSISTTSATANIAGSKFKEYDLNATQKEGLVKNVELLQNEGLKIKNARNLGNVTFVQMSATDMRGNSRTIEGFVDNSTSAIYIGGGYDSNGTKLSFPMDVNAVMDAVVLTMGTGDKKLIVVTDPECPYCRKFEKLSAGKLNEYTISVVLMPLSFHKVAKPMTNYVLNGKNNAERVSRFKAVMEGESKDMYKTYTDKNLTNKLDAYLPKSKVAVAELGATGTPSFYILDGNQFTKTDWGSLVK